MVKMVNDRHTKNSFNELKSVGMKRGKHFTPSIVIDMEYLNTPNYIHF